MSDAIEFWDQRYRAGRMPWDAGGLPAAFSDFLSRSKSPGRALVPGCGSAYEVRALAEAGWDVVGVDFSPAAVASARQVLGPFGACVRQTDFFGSELRGSFDLIYERTFLCSLPPECWPAYAKQVATLLATGGRLAGFFYYGQESEPPPYPLSDVEASRLFGPWSRRVMDIAIPAGDSLELYAGAERWQEWQRVETRPKE